VKEEHVVFVFAAGRVYYRKEKNRKMVEKEVVKDEDGVNFCGYRQ
jgi:hypothetical protein